MALKHPIMTKTALRDYEIGDYTYGVPKIIGKGSLTIGKFTSIADDVTILFNVEHRHDWTTTYPFSALFADAQHIAGHPRDKGPIIIGNDVWIGHKVTIMSGVTIGNGAVIGANAVVARDVDAYSVVAGNPAVHKKFRFDESWCDYLQRKLKWWEFPLDNILAHIEDILKPPGEHLFGLRKTIEEEIEAERKRKEAEQNEES